MIIDYLIPLDAAILPPLCLSDVSTKGFMYFTGSCANGKNRLWLFSPLALINGGKNMSKSTQIRCKSTIEILKEQNSYYWLGNIPSFNGCWKVGSIRLSTDKKALRLAKLLNPNFRYVIVPVSIR